MFLLGLLIGCGTKNNDSGTDSQTWSAAPLQALSGTCPVIDDSQGLQSFTSADQERRVRLVVPQDPVDGMRVVFFFHGLVPEGSNPTENTIDGLDLSSLADEFNTVFIVPESSVWELVGQRFHLWSIEQGTEVDDLTMFDDLRTCVANHFDGETNPSVDLDTLISAGFSGGALFNTIVLTQRADTLAAAVQMSGGSDIEVATFSNLFSPYQTPETKVPVFLVSGGTEDVWPNSSFPVVDFSSSTTNLFEQLQNDGHLAVHCKHNSGHTITNRAYSQSIEWMMEHRFGETSPFVEPKSEWDDWCTWGE